MLRQLARLTRPVPAVGPRALAIAVYSDADDGLVAARESGYEGVACVDDAARALELYCDLWNVTRLRWALRWCQGLLDFILAMQDDEGRWGNFIVDWEGTPNTATRTSVAGGGFWQARALLALARASRIIEDERIDVALRRGMPHVMDATVAPDVRSLHILTAVVLLSAGDDSELRDKLIVWTDELVACRDGDRLMNSLQERGEPHLWGHLQEAALVRASPLLRRDDLIITASRSADLVFRRLVDSGFDQPLVQPFDVACAVYVLDALADVTGQAEYRALAMLARAWFDGRNSAQRPVYDRGAGRVGDGIDGGRVSANSGAESNIVGAQALFSDVVVLGHRLPESEVLPVSWSTQTRR